MTTVPRPGWYRDPAGTPDTFRWWDGESWTDHLGTSATAPPPAADSGLPPELADPDEQPRSPRRRSPVRAVIALVVVIALFLSAGLGVGLWLWDVGSQRGAETGARTWPPRDPTAADPSEPAGQLDESTRTATIGPASMQLPDDPYQLRSDPMRIRGVLDPIFAAEAEVHDRYDGEHDWGAMVALAAVDPKLAAGADLSTAGKAAMLELASKIYGAQLTRFDDVEFADRSVDGHAGIEITAEVHYAVDRLPSRYDAVRAVVVRLEDGTLVAAISSVPDDADEELTELADASLESLTIT